MSEAFDPSKIRRDDHGRFATKGHAEAEDGTQALAPGSLDQETIDAYLDGDCWHLALAIRARTGLPLVFANNTADARDVWQHVGVRLPDGCILDIEGAHDEGDWRTEWVDVHEWPGTIYEATTDERVNELMSGFIEETGGERVYPHVDTEAVVNHLVATHLEVLSVATDTDEAAGYPERINEPTADEAAERARLIRHPWEGPNVELHAGVEGDYEWVAARESELRQALGKSLLPLDELQGAKIWISSNPLPGGRHGRGGEYDPKTDTIRVHPQVAGNQFVILHELGHRHSAKHGQTPKPYRTDEETYAEERYADLFAEHFSTRGGSAELPDGPREPGAGAPVNNQT